MNVNDEINYYMIELIKAFNENPSIDPIHQYEFLRSIQLPTETEALEQDGELSDEEEEIPTQFTLQNYEGYLNGNQEDINVAENDKSGAFIHHYEPLLLIDFASKFNEGSQREQHIQDLADGRYKILFDTQYLVMIQNTKTGRNVIALRGTQDPTKIKSLDDFRNSFKDIILHDLIGIQTLGDVRRVMGDTLESMEELLKQNPQLKADITSHSLGAMRGDTLHNKYENNIENSYLFNVGQSFYSPTGLKVRGHQNQYVYRIADDILSVPENKIRAKSNYIELGKRRAFFGKFLNITDEDRQKKTSRLNLRNILDFFGGVQSLPEILNKIKNPAKMIEHIKNTHTLDNFYSKKGYSQELDKKIKAVDGDIQNLFLHRNKKFIQYVRDLKKNKKEQELKDLIQASSLQQVKLILSKLGVRKERAKTLYRASIKKTKRETPHYDLLSEREKKELVDATYKDLITKDFYNIF